MEMKLNLNLRSRAVLSSLVSAAMAIGGLSASAAEAQKKPEAGKVLIAFYSYTGNTRAAAEQIRKAVGGDWFEIKPLKPYPSSHSACVAQAKKEIRDGFAPALADEIDLTPYEVIFLGSPNWWGTMAPPVLAFIKKNRFTGKTIIPFFTHGGGGVQHCEEDMRKYCEAADAGKILDPGVYSGKLCREPIPELAQWAEKSLKDAQVKKK